MKVYRFCAKVLAVAMDPRWANGEISRSQREALFQIGFTTAEVNERTDLRPLNALR